MTRWPWMLGTSLVLNLILVLLLLRGGRLTQRAVREAMAEAADDAIAVHQKVLDALSGNGPASLEAVRQDLRTQIEVQQRLRYKLRTGEPMPVP